MPNETWSWADVQDVAIVPKRNGRANRPKLPSSRVDEIRRLAEQGKSAKEAGEILGMTRNAVLGCAFRNKIKFHGHDGRPAHVTEENIERVRKWMADHPFAMQKECAEAFGMHFVTMSKIAKRLRKEWKDAQ